MTRLTAADKIMRGYGLSQQDMENLMLLNDPSANGKSGLQKVKEAVQRGGRPMSIAEQLRHYLDNACLGEDKQVSGIHHVGANASTSQSNPFAHAVVEGNTFDVVEGIAFPSAPAMTFYIDQDAYSGSLQVNTAAFGQTNPGYMWRVFIPALSTLNFRVSAASTLSNEPVQLLVKKYRLTDLWRVRLGLVKSSGGVPGRTFADVWSGLA